MSNYTTKDNTKEVLSAMDKAIERGLVAIGMTAEKYAKKASPVDTGLLRNSITYAVSGKSPAISSYKDNAGEQSGTYEGDAPSDKEKAVYLGTNVEYAIYAELGSPTIKAYHMLRAGATFHSDEFRKLMEDSIKNA